MKKLLLALALLFLPSLAMAQCNGVFPNNTVCGNATGSSNTPRPINPSTFQGSAGGTNGQIQYNNSGALGGFTASGDATINTNTGIVTLAPNLVNCYSDLRLAKTANYTVTSADNHSVIALGGNAYFNLTFLIASGYAVNSCFLVLNEDSWGTGRGKFITVTGFGTFYLWPTQSAVIFSQNNVWQVNKSPRARLPGGVTNLYSDFTNGSDTYGVTDCLSTGVSACKSAEQAFLLIGQEFDFAGVPTAAQVKINMAAATLDTQGIHAPSHGQAGAQGGAAIQFVGASIAITTLADNGGGLCRLTLPSTSTYATNQIVSTYDIVTTTTCNGTWKVTVIDGTHLDLQSSTYSAGTGGTITNGSGFSVTGADGMNFYFGTVVQLSNLIIGSNFNSVNFLWGSKGYILKGNVFNGSPVGGLIAATQNGVIEIDGSVGIASGGGAAVLAANGANIAAGLPVNIDILPGLNPTYSLAFGAGSTLGSALFGSITINTNGNTVTGVRCTALVNGAVVSATGVPNTYFPGNSNCTAASGGQTL